MENKTRCAVIEQDLKQIVDDMYLSAAVVIDIDTTNVILPNSTALITSNSIYTEIAKLSNEISLKIQKI